MEEKKYKVRYSVSIIAFVVVLIVVVALGVWGFLIYNQNKDEDNVATNNVINIVNVLNEGEEVVEPEDEDEELVTQEEIVYNELTEKVDGIEGLYVTSVESDGDSYVLKGIEYGPYTFNEDRLDEIIDEGKMILDDVTYSVKEGDVMDALYNLYADGDDYPLYGINKKDTNVYELVRYAQINNVWKLTDSYGMVTVNGDVAVYDDYSGELIGTVTECFADMKNINLNYSKEDIKEYTILDGDRTFSFDFVDGKVVMVHNMLTSI